MNFQPSHFVTIQSLRLVKTEKFLNHENSGIFSLYEEEARLQKPELLAGSKFRFNDNQHFLKRHS